MLVQRTVACHVGDVLPWRLKPTYVGGTTIPSTAPNTEVFSAFVDLSLPCGCESGDGNQMVRFH